MGSKAVNDKAIKYRNKAGEYHRTDGPALELPNGTKYWFKEGKCHRTDGPAVEHADGAKSWFVEGRLHRTDGPAVEYANGNKYWYIDGIEYSLEQYIDLVLEEVQIDIVLNHLPRFKSNE
jgi:hypothetical protein